MQFANTALDRCLCWENGGWCDDNNWEQCRPFYMSLLWAAMPAIIGATLVFVAACVYVVARILSCCLLVAQGGRLGKTKTTKTYRKMTLFAFAAMVIVAVVASMLGAGQVESGIEVVSGKVSNEASDIAESMDLYLATVRDCAGQIYPKAWFPSENYEVQAPAFRPADAVTSWMQTIMDISSDAVGYSWVLGASPWVAVLFSVGVVVAAVCNIHRVVPECNTAILLLTVTYVLTVQFSFATTAKATQAVCADYPAVQDRLQTITHDKLGCKTTGPGTGTLSGLFAEVDVLSHAYGVRACGVPIPGARPLSPLQAACGSLFSCGACLQETFDGAKEVIGTSVIANASLCSVERCSIRDCAKGGCEDGSAAMAAARRVIEWEDAVAANLLVLNRIASDVGTCHAFDRFVADVRPATCDSFEPALWPYATVMAVAVYCCLLMLALSMAGNYCRVAANGDAEVVPVTGKPVSESDGLIPVFCAWTDSPKTAKYGTINGVPENGPSLA